MKIFGDVTDKERSAAQELQEMEAILALNKRKLPRSRVAKGYICLVYDWYKIGMEEEGNRLLQKIDQMCPDYFKKYLVKHMVEDKVFDELIKKLFVEFAFLLTNKPQQYIPMVISNQEP